VIEARDVTLAVLNYNGREFLEVILPSIAAQSSQGFRVHVLDNASSDDSLAYVAEHWPGVRVFGSAENLGVTRNMARAITTCQTPYVSVLNNDIELHERWLEELMAELDAHPEAAAVDAKMLAFHEREVIDGVGDSMARTGYPTRRGEREVDRGQYDEPCEVFSVSGGCGLYRVSAFARVGNYDEDFVAYYEDVDWGYRARLAGLTNRTAPKAIAYHMGSATNDRKPGGYADRIVCNMIVVTLKNLPGPLLWRWAPRILFFQAKLLLFHIRWRRGRSHFRGLRWALRALPATLRKRREIQRARVVEPAAIAAVIGRR
jgi:GT2 family glycosyltransferase